MLTIPKSNVNDPMDLSTAFVEERKKKWACTYVHYSKKLNTNGDLDGVSRH